MDMKAKTIHDHAFQVSQPYTAGAVINEAEARALNQVRSENIGNNLRTKIKELLDKQDIAGAEALVAELDASYVFSFSTGERKSADPIETEARKLARDLIRNKLAEKGRKLTTVPEGETEESWKATLDAKIDEVAAMEAILKVAKKNVADRKKKSEQMLDAVNAEGGIGI